jgi:hypothetical protein
MEIRQVSENARQLHKVYYKFFSLDHRGFPAIGLGGKVELTAIFLPVKES